MSRFSVISGTINSTETELGFLVEAARHSIALNLQIRRASTHLFNYGPQLVLALIEDHASRMLSSNIDCVPAASGTEMGANAAVSVSVQDVEQ
ncbi:MULTISPECIES: hypothetical protein [Mesorhizobium]|uniref:hypothetical protein n=1 Tax=Mesorhizobium TaxID=68287 RepID=UPI001140B138|nr:MULTISPECIES: hypothetical protein [Mesorhizobium]QIA25313.1 hypothetical protein A9K68_028820 [Mesorhizobium sp. AA22]